MNNANLFQIKLKSVLVNENGAIKENVKGVNAIETSLFYPKEGVPSITSVRTLQLEDKIPLDYTTKPLKEQIVFKQSFDGDSVLEVNLTVVEKIDKLGETIFKVLGAAAVAAVGTISGIGAVVTAAAKTTTESIFTLPKAKIYLIGTGNLPIDKNTKDGVYEVALRVPKKVEIFKINLPLGRGGREMERIKLTLDEGFVNGRVVFDIKRL